MMGGDWNYPGSPLIRVSSRFTSLSVSYGEKDWPSRSYRLFVWEAE